jgi:hypothetical protein
MRDVYREEFGEGREGDRIVVIATRDASPLGCVSVKVARGDLGMALTLSIKDARALASRLDEAAAAAADPTR